MVYYLKNFGSNKKLSMQNVFSGNNLMMSVGIPLLVTVVFIVYVSWKKPERFSKMNSDGKKVVEWKKTLMWSVLLFVITLALTYAIMHYGMSDSSPASSSV